MDQVYTGQHTGGEHGLVRFSDDVIEVVYKSSGVAEVRVNIQHIYDIDDVLQHSDPDCFLVELENSNDAFEYFTTWESDILYDNKVFLSGSIYVERIRSTKDLQNEAGEIRVDTRLSEFAALMASNQANFKITATVYECIVGASNEVSLLYKGEVMDSENEGYVQTLKASRFGGAGEGSAINIDYCTTCNYALFDPYGCKISKDSVKVTGVIESLDPYPEFRIADVTYPTQLGTIPFSDDDFFYGGYLEVGSGAGLFRTGISWSAQFTDSETGLPFLKIRPEEAIPSKFEGEIVTVYPGCSGRWPTDCQEKFGNFRVNGFPFAPEYIEQLPTSSSMGK